MFLQKGNSKNKQKITMVGSIFCLTTPVSTEFGGSSFHAQLLLSHLIRR